jgi:nucleoside-diphosphate-sugar epimerase
MCTALVLGTGQVGTFAAARLLQDGAAVVAGDVLPNPGFFGRFGPSAAELATVDVLDHTAVAALIRRSRADVVVLAAGLDASSCRRNPARGWLVNARAPDVVATAALAGGATRLVLVSSFAVYGRATEGPVSERAPLAARSVYGRSKAAGEAVVLKRVEHDLEVRIVRPSSVYGPTRPGFGSQSSRLVDRLLLLALADGAPTSAAPRAGDDEYIYVKDLARAISLVALHPRLPQPIALNVGSGEVTHPGSLGRAVGRAVPGRWIAVERVEGDSPRFPLDVARVRELVGFEPRYDLAAGLSDYVGTMVDP